MKTIRVDIHEKLAPVFIKEEQKLNVSVIDCIPLESKMKSGQSRMNKTHKYKHLFRFLWKLDYLDPIWINGSTNNFISSRSCNRWYKANKILGKFLNKKDTIQVLLCFKKAIYQCIVLANILQINTKYVSCTKHTYWLSPLKPVIVLQLAYIKHIPAALLVCYCLLKQ